jgi:hypothetical protein
MHICRQDFCAMVFNVTCKVRFAVIIFILIFNENANSQIQSMYQNPIEKFTSGVKKIIHKHVFDGEMKTIVFEYNKYNRISKEIEYFGNGMSIVNMLTMYTYNSDQQCKEKILYKRRELYPYGFDVCSTIKYTYKNKLLISEITLSPENGTKREILYSYKNNRVISKTFSVNDSLLNKSAINYDNNRIVWEVNETVGNEQQDTVKYVYSGDTLIGVMFLRGFLNGNFKYTYNIHGQVINARYINNQMSGISYVDTFEYQQ